MSRIFEEMDVVLDPNELNSLSSPVDGRADPTGSFPKQEYVDGSGVNDKARGTKRTNVDYDVKRTTNEYWKSPTRSVTCTTTGGTSSTCAII